MPCMLTDRVVTFDADDTAVGVPGQIVQAYPNIDDEAIYFLTNDGGTTWYPVQHPAIRSAETNATGDYTFSIPNPSEQFPSGTTWTVQYDDGSRITGLPPADPGPFGVYDLVTGEGWTSS